MKIVRCFAPGLAMTRHPPKGAAERWKVTAGELTESKVVARFAAMARRHMALSPALYSAGKLPRANLLILREKGNPPARAHRLTTERTAQS